MAKATDITKPLSLPSADDMRKRFHYLRSEVERIETEARPLRDQRDDLANRLNDEIAGLEGQYKAIEAPLFGMKMEMGDLVRLLKGDTGEA